LKETGNYDVLLDVGAKTWACANYFKFSFNALDKKKEVNFRFGDGKENTMDYCDSYILPCIHEALRKEVYQRNDLKFVKRDEDDTLVSYEESTDENDDEAQ
jgi:hypothetical protein